MNKRFLLTLPVSALVVVFAVACGSSGSSGSAYGGSAPATTAPSVSAPASSAPASASGGTTMDIKDFMFTTLTVAPGTKITVTNQDSAPHTATIKTANIDVSVAPGASGTFTAPTKPGSYALTCDVHPSMHGTLTVS